jgi:hypothetical protein
MSCLSESKLNPITWVVAIVPGGKKMAVSGSSPPQERSLLESEQKSFVGFLRWLLYSRTLLHGISTGLIGANRLSCFKSRGCLARGLKSERFISLHKTPALPVARFYIDVAVVSCPSGYENETETTGQKYRY